MKAIQIKQLGRPEVLQLVETETPVPGPGQVLVKVATAGVNFAETMMRQGLYPIQLSLPTILGSEASGTVVAHGANVQTHAIGTRVAVPFTASGSYAEFVVADAASVFPLPERLDFPQATALLVQGLTAYFLLRLSAPPQPGQSILIQAAAGGVGSLAVQLAKLWGAGTVIATASTTEKLELARRLGADVAINYTEPDWVTQVRQATNGKGVDIVLESVGGQIGEQSLQALAPHGRL
ncbi:MAG TPA: zinc-binding dehydrogenase, partial [Ktedonobacteraceae bacterium]|nr:zinc-binding dehydrogenase [Ktedonobacteraceae bacterium]